MRTHFIVSQEPLGIAFKMPMKAECGHVLAHPYPVMMQEMFDRGVPEFNSLRDCSECRKAVEKAAAERNSPLYVYGLVEGQEAFRGDTITGLEEMVGRLGQ